MDTQSPENEGLQDHDLEEAPEVQEPEKPGAEKHREDRDSENAHKDRDDRYDYRDRDDHKFNDDPQ